MANQSSQVKEALVLIQAARKMCKTVDDLSNSTARNLAELAIEKCHALTDAKSNIRSSRGPQELFNLITSVVYLPPGPWDQREIAAADVADEKKHSIPTSSVLVYFSKNGGVVGQSLIPTGFLDPVCGGDDKKYYIITDKSTRFEVPHQDFLAVSYQGDLMGYTCGDLVFNGKMLIDSNVDL